jgi:hypothetical protein
MIKHQAATLMMYLPLQQRGLYLDDYFNTGWDCSYFSVFQSPFARYNTNGKKHFSLLPGIEENGIVDSGKIPVPKLQHLGQSPETSVPYLRPYSGPKLPHALKSAPMESMSPKLAHTLGRSILSGGTLCICTGIRSIDASVIRSPPTCS